MATTEILASNQSHNNIGQAALTMAVGIVLERVQKLSPDDLADLHQLLKDLSTAQTSEDRESIGVAMLEILDQKPVRLQLMELTDETPGPALRAWLDCVSVRIRELREAKGWTQQMLAEKTGLPQSYVSRVESAVHSPSRVALEQIAAALEVPLSEFDSSP